MRSRACRWAHMARRSRADAIDFNDALRLLQLRAQLMERAYPHGYGMLAVSGLSEREVEPSLPYERKAAFIANLNAPRQIVVAGADGDLDLVRQQALQAGARKAERLAVSVPSHCVLLDDAARELTEAQQDRIQAPSIPYIGNRGARPLRQAEAIRAWTSRRTCDIPFDGTTRPSCWANSARKFSWRCRRDARSRNSPKNALPDVAKVADRTDDTRLPRCPARPWSRRRLALHDSPVKAVSPITAVRLL